MLKKPDCCEARLAEIEWMIAQYLLPKWYLGPGNVSPGTPYGTAHSRLSDSSMQHLKQGDHVLRMKKRSILFKKKLPTVENSHDESTQGLEKVPQIAPNLQITKSGHPQELAGIFLHLKFTQKKKKFPFERLFTKM